MSFSISSSDNILKSYFLSYHRSAWKYLFDCINPTQHYLEVFSAFLKWGLKHILKLMTRIALSDLQRLIFSLVELEFWDNRENPSHVQKWALQKNSLAPKRLEFREKFKVYNCRRWSIISENFLCSKFSLQKCHSDESKKINSSLITRINCLQKNIALK